LSACHRCVHIVRVGQNDATGYGAGGRVENVLRSAGATGGRLTRNEMGNGGGHKK
jgi:hypothetical protein